ncbi:hypothetical protein CHCC14820_1118 [Bacillus paralicheniformis]|nr:hypothetical protein CHCC14821_4396 [Bacillus paralicheniformis]TWM31388.1 hypothetical protein CHCC14820_1118 [Bacillus paralicheniformis]
MGSGSDRLPGQSEIELMKQSRGLRPRLFVMVEFLSVQQLHSVSSR